MSSLLKESGNCEVVFSNREYDLELYIEKKERELFYYLLNIDEYTNVLSTAQKIVVETHDKLQKTWPQQKHFHLDYNERNNVLDYLLSIHQKQREKEQKQLPENLTRKQISHLLLQHAPTALIDGAWLQNIGSIVHCHTEISAILFQIYSYKVGDFKCEHNHFNLYREILQNIPISVPEIHSLCFATQPEIIDSAFTIPTYYLAIAQFPRLFLPEIIGITLAHLFAGFDLFYLSLEELSKQHFSCHYFERQPFYCLTEQHQDLAQKIIDAFLQNTESHKLQSEWERIWLGFSSVYLLSEKWKQQTIAIIEQPQDISPREKMMMMIANKGPYSRGHHRDTLIGDKTLPEWFDGDEINVGEFLDAFADSPFIDRTEPEKSLFFTHLISFGGAMFRVFTDDEIEIVKQWISSLPEEKEHNTKIVCPYHQKKVPAKVAKPKHTPKLMKAGIRDAYYYLVNIDIYPEAAALAKKYTQRYLRKTLRYMPFFPKIYKFFPYDHNAFSDRIHEIYNKQISAYKEFEAPPRFSHEAYDWLMYQLAPLILVDGCWLQNVARSGNSHTQVATFLFNTFSDEIGNGDTTWNHANVYRRLLETQKAQLPEFNSKEFAHHPQIIKAAFDLPVLQLGISQFPKAFQPELIGLNLAIEMGGLGWEYMTFVDELNYWGIDPYIVSLHISIDNMASGHTAWAMEAVQIYLDQVLNHYGREEVQRQWKRIWTGYLAYKIARLPLQINIGKQYLKDVLYKSVGLRKKTNSE